MRYILILITSLYFNFECKASLYQCDKPEASPILVDTSPKKINLSYKSATWNESIRSNNKTPYLIYYVVDSAEPFMKHSVFFESANLIKKCSDGININFALILNSLYTERNQIIVCKDKALRFINLSDFPAIDSNLLLKREHIKNGDHTLNDRGPMKYLVKYENSINETFYKYPLAHPDFLHDLLNFIQTEKTLFAKSKYMPFVHLKSHGSEKTILSGLHNCQLEAKTRAQRDQMNKILNKSDRSFLNEINSVEDALKNLEEFDIVISKLGLGTNAGTVGNLNLGNYNLGNYNLGSVAGLGETYGLGADLSFGLYHVTLNAVFDDLYAKNKQLIGFLMLESCESRRDSTFTLIYMKSIQGYYSASQSLWYRNFDWWNLLQTSQNSSKELIKILKNESEYIKNIEIMD